ncbi:hypothetical protein H2203_007618 [Taxawa tesnikishii (nom. ined.)]|nr:hypothetical protein H2203_007618 [Dothideales sp. JES 119]
MAARWDEVLEDVLLYQQRMREQNAEEFNNRKNATFEQLNVGQEVLIHDTKRKKIRRDKLLFRWYGPSRIKSVTPTGTYVLETLDSIEMKGTYTRNRLKPWIRPILPTTPERLQDRLVAAKGGMPSPEDKGSEINLQDEELEDELPADIRDTGPKVIVSVPRGFDPSQYEDYME